MEIPRENTNRPHFITFVGGKALYVYINPEKLLQRKKSEFHTPDGYIIGAPLHSWTVGRSQGNSCDNKNN